MKLVALVDCNSFYCSCEKIFRPEFRNHPVIVLSNNDGCAIAFTKEAKAIGFGQMCEAFFKVKDRIKQHKVAVFSSNYTLYDDISKRVMSILREFSSHVEVYSIDEAFATLEVDPHTDIEALGRKIRSEIFRRVGMPVGVGISYTKVLAKVANKLSKKYDGVCVLIEPATIDQHLKEFPVRDIWGIGPRSAAKLISMDLKTAYQFKSFPDGKIIQKVFTKTGKSVFDELNGINCLSSDELEEEDKQMTGNSRSFGFDVYDKHHIKEALAQFATNATQKLREQKTVCFGITAYIHTNPFKPGPQYYGIHSIRFSAGTSDVIKIIKASHEILDRIFKPGYGYKKGGVLLTHIVPEDQNQMELFNQDYSDNSKINEAMDMINKKYGPQTVKSGACGIQQAWKTIHDYKSFHYTTDWNQLLKVEL